MTVLLLLSTTLLGMQAAGIMKPSVNEGPEASSSS